MSQKEFDWGELIGIGIIIGAASIVTYVLDSLSWEFAFENLFYLISGFILVFLMLIFVFNPLKMDGALFENLWNIFLVALLISLFIAGVLRLVLVGGGYLLKMPSAPQTTAIGTCMVLAASIILFVIRLKYRLIYGLSEVIAGLGISILRFSGDFRFEGHTDANFYLAILTAAVYVIVRGFDNIHQSMKQHPVDPVYAYISSRLK